MSQFGASKNPPWARAAAIPPPGIATPTLQPMIGQPGLVSHASMYNALGVTQQAMGVSQPALGQHQYSAQQIAAIQLGQVQVQGLGMPTTLSSNPVPVSYPSPRTTAPPPKAQQRVFTGTVTKLHDNFGFVDEDVFFQTSCVKGNSAKVGDRVLVEATYNANMPFKWNATRIQVLPNQALSQPPNQATSAPPPLMNTSVPPPGFKPPGGPGATQAQQQQPVAPANLPNLSQPPPPLMGQSNQNFDAGRGIPGTRRPDTVNRYDREKENSRRESDRERDRERERERERRRSPRKRSRSPRKRSRSPRRSPTRSSRRTTTRIVPRYMVQIPKISLDTKDTNVITLRSRYTNLYIPSDFFNAEYSWHEGFPLYRPFQLGNKCNFHVMSKDVDPVGEDNSVTTDPSDSDHLYSAKVMLLASPIIEDLYHKSCALADDSSELRENFQHPTRLIQFLVGLKGKSEPMAIGGAWSPSLDGDNPGNDPSVLIRTAIRTTKALTGIDLNSCTQWYRFAEVRYHRAEEIHKGRHVPARVETVVIFLPDIWSCMPTRLEWGTLQRSYKQQFDDKMVAEKRADQQGEEEDMAEGQTAEKKSEPTPWTELDPKTLNLLKVTELRQELESRSLSSKGLKSQLIARLTKVLKCEQEKEEQDAENKKELEDDDKEDKIDTDDKDDDKKKREDEDKKRKDEKDKVSQERRYQLPDNESIIVHPSTTAKSGKFDCANMSLSVLLDYRPEDNKEHSFEVSLFAEMFNEMLMRDFGYHIYKALLSAPEKKEDDKEEKKDKPDAKEPSSKRRKTDDEKESKADKKRDDDKERTPRDKRDEDDKTEEVADEKDDDSEQQIDKEKKRDKDKKKEKVKFYTADRELLLAFVYYDQSHTGYLLDKDVEEIFHTIGLSLSRAQVKKLVNKLVSRDTLNYRKITDKPRVKDGDKREAEKKAGEEDQATNEITETVDEETVSKGNNVSIPSRNKVDSSVVTSTASDSDGKSSGDQNKDMVMFKGSFVDINSIMQRLEKSEKARNSAESKLRQVQDEMDSLQENFSTSEQHGQKVTTELQELKKKLREQRKTADESLSNTKKYHDTLSRLKQSMSVMMQDVSSVVKEETVKVKTEKKENGL